MAVHGLYDLHSWSYQKPILPVPWVTIQTNHQLSSLHTFPHSVHSRIKSLFCVFYLPVFPHLQDLAQKPNPFHTVFFWPPWPKRGSLVPNAGSCQMQVLSTLRPCHQLGSNPRPLQWKRLQPLTHQGSLCSPFHKVLLHLPEWNWSSFIFHSQSCCAWVIFLSFTLFHLIWVLGSAFTKENWIFC